MSRLGSGRADHVNGASHDRPKRGDCWWMDGRRRRRRVMRREMDPRKSDTNMTHAYEASPRCERRGRKKTELSQSNLLIFTGMSKQYAT